MSIDPGQSGGAVTKQVLRISLTRLIQLSGDLARARGGKPVRVSRGDVSSMVVPLRVPAAATRPPLVLIHPVGGSVIAYRRLAGALDPQQPVYAIENQVAFRPGVRLHRTVEGMATAYLDLIRPLADGGPVLLGGYSMGGLIAFEMARQLLAQGDPVGLLAIVDTPTRVAPTLDDGRDEALSPRDLLTMITIVGRRIDREIGIDEAELERLGPDERVSRVIAVLRDHGVVPPGVDLAVFHEIVAAIRSNDAAQRSYRPRRYDGDLDLLRSRDVSKALSAETGGLYADPTFGWQDVCARPVRVSVVPGSHLELMDPPYVEAVGEWLQARIDQVLM